MEQHTSAPTAQSRKWLYPCWLASLAALAFNFAWFAYSYVSHWSEKSYVACVCVFIVETAAFTLLTLLLRGGLKRGKLALLTAASAVLFAGLHGGSGGLFNIVLFDGGGKGPSLAAGVAILLAAAQFAVLIAIGRRALRGQGKRPFVAAPVILAVGVVAAALLVLGAHTKLFYADEPIQKKPAPPPGETVLAPYIPAAPALAPRLIETIYPTEDVVIAEIVATEAPYGADPTGQTDSTGAIQRAIDDCALAGGGTVWLPVGRYLVTQSVTVRTYVTLRGDWQDPDEGKEYGTVILARPPSGDAALPALFAIEPSAGVLGLTVYYPDQRADDVKPYPCTFSGDGMLPNIVNCTVLNGYRGLGLLNNEATPEATFHEQLTLENFKGTFLSVGIASYRSSDTGTTKNVVIDPKYWAEAGGEFACDDPAALRAYMRANATGLELADLDWEQFCNVRIRGCETGVRTVKGLRESGFIGSFYDLDIRDCGVGISVESPDPHGFSIANSYVQGDEAAIRNMDGNTLRACGVEIVGKVEGKLIQTEFESLPRNIDYYRRAPRPPARLFPVEADASGITDCAAAIQQAIDKCALSGGGVVYLSAGRYRLNSPVTLPANVELRGTAATAQREDSREDAAGGAVVYAYPAFCETGAQADKAEALITLAGENAGVRGLRFVCPENRVQYAMPPSAYLIRGRAPGVYAVNISFLAPWNGIDFRNCDGHFIKKITCYALHNMAAVGGENGLVEGCLHNGNAYRCTYDFPEWHHSEGGDFGLIFDSTSRIQTDVWRIEGARDQTVLNMISFGARTLIDAENSEGTLVVNYNADAVGHTPLFWRFSVAAPALRVNGGSLIAVNELRSRGRLFEAREGARVSVCNPDETA